MEEGINKIRLILLAEYLEKTSKKQLIPSVITIGHKLEDGTCREMLCPDYGQWLPWGKIFPYGDWIQNHNKLWILNESLSMPTSTCFCIMYYLNIEDFWLYMHLFVPYFQNVEVYGGKVLQHHIVNPKDVAYNIRALMAK